MTLERKLFNNLPLLAELLHQAAVHARAKYDAISDDATESEIQDAIIEALDLPWRIAEHMIELAPKDEKDAEAKALAQAYIDGRYLPINKGCVAA